MKEFLLWLFSKRPEPEVSKELQEAQRLTDVRQRRLESLEYERRLLERERRHRDDDAD